MSLIKVETVADRPITAEMLADTRVLDCLGARNGTWRYSLLSADRHRMICTFEAPDAESVRQAYRQADVGFTKVWTAQVIEPEGVPPVWNEPILKLLEGSYPNGFTDEEWNEALRLILPCYQERGIEWVRSYASQDKTRVLWELNAPDAEVIREAHGKAGIPFDRVWSAEVLRP
ncbi:MULTISPECIES: DUF4242 domain-containing protein [unclassified Microcoleus]|uniref:DUF4242 domain-containing protein n=1 Tax=unclassified Microcoleus TaxID=2642155 RepID=UPI002FCF6E12